MSKEEKKAPVKAIAKAEVAVKPVKNVPATHSCSSYYVQQKKAYRERNHVQRLEEKKNGSEFLLSRDEQPLLHLILFHDTSNSAYRRGVLFLEDP